MALLMVFFAGLAIAETAKEVRELLEWGDNDLALERAEEGLEIRPHDVELKFYHALALARTGENDDALEAFEELARLHPNSPEVFNNIAVLHAKEGNYDAAREALETALATHPAYRTAHKNLADIYSAEAAEAYNKALARDEQRDIPKPELHLLTSWKNQPALKQAKKPETEKKISLAKSSKVETQAAPVKPLPVEKPVKAAADKKDSNLAKLVAEAETAGIKEAETPPEKPLKEKTIKQEAMNNLPGPTPEEAAVKLAIQETKVPVAEAVKDTGKKQASEEKGEPETVAPAMAQQAAKAVEDWAQAWRSQNADAYVSAYAAFFRPESGESHKEWEEQRRDRVTSPNYIRVSISNLKIRLKGEGRAVASFRQEYQSDSYQDTVNKNLYLENIGGKWLIVREVSE